MEFITYKREQKLLVINICKYYFAHGSKCGNISWQYANKKCLAKMYTLSTELLMSNGLVNL